MSSGAHVLIGTFEDGAPVQKSWCGVDTHRLWVFQDPGHLAVYARQQGSILPCRACRDAIVKALLALEVGS